MLLGLLLGVNFNAFAWDYTVGEEDWGEACYASEKNQSGVELTILTQRDNFGPIMEIDPYEDRHGYTFPISIFVDSALISTLDATRGEYFAGMVADISTRELNALASGSFLRIEIARQETVEFSLKGSAKAIQSLMACSQKRRK